MRRAAILALLVLTGCAYSRRDEYPAKPGEPRVGRVVVVVCIFASCQLPPPAPAQKKAPPDGGAD